MLLVDSSTKTRGVDHCIAMVLHLSKHITCRDSWTTPTSPISIQLLAILNSVQWLAGFIRHFTSKITNKALAEIRTIINIIDWVTVGRSLAYHLCYSSVRHYISGMYQAIQHLSSLFYQITLVRILFQLVILKQKTLHDVWQLWWSCEATDGHYLALCYTCINKHMHKQTHHTVTPVRLLLPRQTPYLINPTLNEQ